MPDPHCCGLSQLQNITVQLEKHSVNQQWPNNNILFSESKSLKSLADCESISLSKPLVLANAKRQEKRKKERTKRKEKNKLFP